MKFTVTFKTLIFILFLILHKNVIAAQNTFYESNSYEENTSFGQSRSQQPSEAYSYPENEFSEFSKAGGPPGPPEDVPIDNHIIYIFIIALLILMICSKKYSDLRHNKS